MAETLGSLVDKLSIKNLRLWHFDEIIEQKPDSDPQKKELQAKRDLVVRQIQDLTEEVNGFFASALNGKVKIRDEKLKLYDNRNVSPAGNIKELGKAVSELAQRNIRLWHLEDEVRRTDLADREIVRVKRQIDTSNQERNDLMDKVDAILYEETSKKEKSSLNT